MAYLVKTFSSAKELNNSLGAVTVTEGLDDSQLQAIYSDGDVILSNGLTFTVINGTLPTRIALVLAKGIYYTVIETVV